MAKATMRTIPPASRLSCKDEPPRGNPKEETVAEAVHLLVQIFSLDWTAEEEDPLSTQPVQASKEPRTKK